MTKEMCTQSEKCNKTYTYVMRSIALDLHGNNGLCVQL